MKQLFSTLIFVLICISGWCQHTIATGIVTDNNTSTPLEGVTVRETGNPQNTTSTNKKGMFQLTLPQNGTITCSYTGYAPVMVTSHQKLLHIRLTPVSHTLTEVVVTGFQTNRKLLDVAGALNVVTAADLQRGDNSSIATALNAIPGVRMEEQAPGGSTRLSIRGSVLRSPFGIRGIKVYWNDIPFTTAGGSTAYSLFDPAVLGNIEIIKGPAGSIYGAGTGGVMIMTAKKPVNNEQMVEAGITAGSYGLLRYGLSINSSTAKTQVNATYNEQSYDGYRELQSSTYRKIFTIQSAFNISEKHKLTISVFNTRTNFDLPNALTRAEYEKNPRYVVPIVDTLDGRVTNTSTNVAVSNQYQFSERFSNTSSLYLSSGTIDHPFGSSVFNASYGKASSTGIGGRTRFVYLPTASQNITINFGGEFQRDRDAETSFTNVQGKPGNVTGIYETTGLQYFLFANAIINLPGSLILTLGGSYNRFNYKVVDLFNPSGNMDESMQRSFKGDFSPRVALLKKINPWHSVFASVSAGFGPPTPVELSVAGKPNTDLRSERGTNYEAGARGRSRDGRFQYDFNLYQFNLNDIIISSRMANGSDRYDNSGSARQRGIELLLDYVPIRRPGKFISAIDLFTNLTYNNYKFREFIIKDEQSGNQTVYSGNYLPGIPDLVIASGFDISSKTGLYLHGTWQHFGRRFITNSNQEKDPGYGVANLRAGYKYNWNRIGINLFGGINNLLEETYSEFLAINGFGGRYYLPSPARNYYGGLSLNYSFNQ